VNRDQAYNLIRETFTQAFDKARFRNFAINLLNRMDESKTSAWKGPYIKDAFKDHVNYYERLGTFTSPDNEKLDVLIVHLTTESKLERARTAIRNFVADHLKTRDEKDAALVAFVSPTEKQWRFSYVKMEYATVEKESGKVGVETRLTPARRFSYIVGEGESCHTAQTRFLNLLQDTQTDPKLADIEEVFSVEAVTKEFFKQYANLFGDIHKALEKIVKEDKTIRDEFHAKNVSAVDFAKKLMGQIVFLYFLQKKGWLGVAKGQDWGSGPHDFLRRLANDEYRKYDNFFNDILEPLFYDTLATDRGHEAWCNRFKCRIPFLNGGLFEPLGGYDWKKIDIILPNRLFNNTEYVEEGITGTGVLDVFDRYNFTVNEAEPLEKEVAIDPEMLGKVFENLIEENRRKGLGAYYTPREIVHYMCQESLINYLDTALNPQPVIASEAKQSLQHNSEIASSQTPLLAMTPPEPERVPREDIETFVHLGDQAAFYEAARMSGTKSYKPELPRSIETHARLIDEKLTDITVCDPAVGSGAFLVGMMTEIVRARSSLTPYFNDIHERTPYHFKRHAIQNCLYGVDIDISAVEIAKLRLWLSLVVDEEDVKQIKPLPNLDYKIVAGNWLLGVGKTLFNEKLFRRLEDVKPLYFDESDRQKKDKYKSEIDRLICELTDNKSTFDFEIYFSEVFHRGDGFDVVIMNPPYGARISKSEKSGFATLFKYQDYQLDSYLLFFERSFRLARGYGYIALIIPNTWLQNLLSKKLRRHVFTNKTVEQVNHFATSVFEAVVNNEVVLIKNCPAAEAHNIRVTISAGAGPQPPYFIPQSRWRLSDGEPVNILERPELSTLADKLRALKKLGDFLVVTQGAKPFQVGKGKPPQTRKIVDTKPFVSETKRDKTFRPLLRGSLIRKYQNLWNNDYWISFGDWLAEPRYSANYDAPNKIVIRQTGDSLIATLDTNQFIVRDNLYMIFSRGNAYDLRFVLAIINSQLSNWFYQKVLNPEEGEALAQVKRGHLVKLPMPPGESVVQKPIITLVDQILASKKRETEKDTASLEREIDRHVYALYGLTEEEIAIVEGTAK
jgi:type I restriction-modification system DNA methylase subunit